MTRTASSYYEVAVAGTKLPDGLARAVSQVVVDQRLMLPAELSLTLFGADAADIGPARIAVGADIALTIVQGTTRTKLFTGTIDAIEVEGSPAGQDLHVQAFDALHQLTRGRRTRTFVQQKISDVIAQVAREAGIPCSTDATSTIHPQIMQADESDYDLLARLCTDAGLVMRVEQGKLKATRVPAPAAAPAVGDTLASTATPGTLVAGGNVATWRVRTAKADAVTDVVVTGWDPKTKKVASEKVTTSAPLVAAGTAPKGGGSLHVSVPAMTAPQVKELATARAAASGSVTAELTAEVYGDPALAAGTAVSFGGVGAPFDGRYVVTHARHRFGRDGYLVEVESTTMADRSLLGTIAGTAERAQQRWGGTVIGIVTNAKDPDKRGRVKVKYPWLPGEPESDWARVLHRGAGKDRGLLIVPRVNDEVLVAFQHGSPDHPVVLGGTYNGVDTAPPHGGEAPDRDVWRTESGQRIELVEEKGKESILLTSKGGEIVVAIDGGGKKVSVTTKTAPVDVTAGGAVTVKSKADVTLEGVNVTLKGQNVTLDAKVGLKLKAAAQAELSASGPVTVKGAVIKLN